MKKFLLLCLLGVIPAISCTKETAESSETSCDVQTTLSETEALEQFSQVLSKAVFDNESLRCFIKEEALKQFDNDYDVFYPYVKNSTLSCGRTFRDVLLDYTDDEELKVIEYSLPKLTILVPDFSWVGENCFSVNTWDPSSNQISVGYDDRMDSHPIYVNGECGFELKANSFPSFPVLIVKSNERLNVDSPETKSSAAKYSFVDPVFDNSDSQSSTKGWLWGHTEGELYNSNRAVDLCLANDNFISASDLNAISPESIAAYNEFGSNNYLGGVQRDYIFYGMSSSNTNNGTMNPRMRDLLYRFSIDPITLFNIADDCKTDDGKNFTNTAGNNSKMDPIINETVWTGKNDRPGLDEVSRRFWGDGSFEIQIEYFEHNTDGIGAIGKHTFSIKATELMYITKCHYTFDWNFWGNNWSSYSIDEDDMKPKWFYPGDRGNGLAIFNSSWNLASASDDIWIKVSEYDPSTEVHRTVEEKFSHTTSVSLNAKTTAIEKYELGVSGQNSLESSISYKFEYYYTQESDEIGEAHLYYSNNVITNKGYYYGYGQGYQLSRILCGGCSMSFIPIDLKDEYQITQALLHRTKIRQ